MWVTNIMRHVMRMRFKSGNAGDYITQRKWSIHLVMVFPTQPLTGRDMQTTWSGDEVHRDC